MTETQSNPLRRTASGVFLFGLLVFVAAVYVGLVYWQNTVDAGASWIVRLDLVDWVVLFSVLLVLILVALLILYFLPSTDESPEADDEDLWQAAEPAPAEAEPLTEEEAPLYPPAEAEPEPAAAAEPFTEEAPWATEQDAIAEALLVRCTNCETEFELPYSTERPLTGSCPNCEEDVVLEETEDVLAEEGLDVEDLEGIGPKYAKKLRASGIQTTGQLRVASVERLAEQTGIEESLLTTWRSMADLLRVDGINNQYAELLARAGVYSVDELAQESPTRLHRRVRNYLDSLDRKPTDLPVTDTRCEEWIQGARRVGAH